MPKRKSHPNPHQGDLFSMQPSPPAKSSINSERPVEPALLDDQQLLRALVSCSFTDVEAVGSEVLQRQPAGWTHALLALWDRFRGPDLSEPMIEQKVVLEVIRQSGRGDLLKEIIRRGCLSLCLDADLLITADACGVGLPGEIVRRGLIHKQDAVRAAAVRLSGPARLSSELLHPLLTDRSRLIRRLAATVLAENGDTTGRDVLLHEMKIQPGRAGLEALAIVANEEVVVRLGQIARQHPDWVQVIIDVLDDCDVPKASAVQSSLQQLRA